MSRIYRILPGVGFALMLMVGASLVALAVTSIVAPQVLGGKTEDVGQISEIVETPTSEVIVVQETEHPTRTISEILATLNQEELEAMVIAFRPRYGGMEFIGGYYLHSLDEGETWYAGEYVDDVWNFLGPAEEVYPGLVACLDTRDLVVQYAKDFRPIPPETEDQTDTEQVLITASRVACDNFQELNMPG